MITISLPIADRRTSPAFYRDGLGFEAIGELASDGVPEPLQFELADGARLVLIPTGASAGSRGTARPPRPAGASASSASTRRTTRRSTRSSPARRLRARRS